MAGGEQRLVLYRVRNRKNERTDVTNGYEAVAVHVARKTVHIAIGLGRHLTRGIRVAAGAKRAAAIVVAVYGAVVVTVDGAIVVAIHHAAIGVAIHGTCRQAHEIRRILACGCRRGGVLLGRSEQCGARIGDTPDSDRRSDRGQRSAEPLPFLHETAPSRYSVRQLQIRGRYLSRHGRSSASWDRATTGRSSRISSHVE